MNWNTFKKKKFLGLIALAVLSAGGISFKLTQGDGSNKDITEFTIAAESGSLPGLITASGELKANKSVNDWRHGVCIDDWRNLIYHSNCRPHSNINGNYQI